jgi:hypothetical protein
MMPVLAAAPTSSKAGPDFWKRRHRRQTRALLDSVRTRLLHRCLELTDPKRTGDPLVAGGRYDDLLTRLGASDPIAAIGFAVWIERLAIYGDTP